MLLTNKEPRIASVEPEEPTRRSQWAVLYRIGGYAAAVAAVVTPVTIAVFSIWPPPYDEPATEWFELLTDNPLLGLMSLDLGFVVVTALMIPLMTALTVALYRTRPALVVLAGALFFVGVAAFFGTNPSIEMLSLSDRYVEAQSAAERLVLAGAGEGLMASFDGTAFHVNYVLGQLAGIGLGFVMLRSPLFGRRIALVMIAGNAIGFGLYLPVVGLAVSALSGLVLWVWMVMVARRLLQLSAPLGR
jgi:hypothetical protein